MEKRFKIGEKVYSSLNLEPYVVVAYVVYKENLISYLVMDQDKNQTIVPSYYLISEIEYDIINDQDADV